MKNLILSLAIIFSSNIFANYKRVIFIGIDGLGSHNLWRETINGVATPAVPNINKMKEKSAWTSKAKIDLRNWSGPNWVGMITGSNSNEHGVFTNKCEYSKNIPTIYQMIKEQIKDSRITLIYDWGKIKCHSGGKFVDSFRPSMTTSLITQRALRELKENAPTFLFVYYGKVDINGHRHGGASKEYKEALEGVDHGVGEILNYLESSGKLKETLIILTADHGHHPTNREHSTTEFPVPLFLMGPGVFAGEILEEVKNNQVAPIIAFALGINPSPKWSSTIENLDTYFDGI